MDRAVLRKVSRRIDCGLVEHEQAYRICLSEDGVEIFAHDAAGMFYATQTLEQIETLVGNEVPCGEIDDWPDFKVRGYLLDISRDRVPSLGMLCSIIDKLAAWKINQLQLYTEHTIAYRGHEAVWGKSSALSFDDLQVLEKYCKDKHIDFVPCQNLFGHMQRWLTVDGYKGLAECPDGWDTPWGYRSHEPFSLNPSDPRSIRLVSDLVGQLAPRSGSSLFNICCDETMDVGQGKSKDRCERDGRGVVYLEFLNKVCRHVRSFGKTPMFWGDVVLHHPELTQRLPDEAVLLNWGYEAGHPFMEQTRMFSEAGVRQYVCPGTSSWCSLAGRGENMVCNISAAAEAGLAYRAEGFLITDWGDYGHWQPFVVSWPGIAYGASVSWATEANLDRGDLPEVLNDHVFKDKTGRFGEGLWALSNVYLQGGPQVPNSTWWFDFLRSANKTFTGGVWDKLKVEHAEQVLTALDCVQLLIDKARPTYDQPALLTREVNWSIGMIRWVSERICEGAGLNGTTPSEWRSFARQGAVSAFDELVTEYKALWMKRCRPGGLVDSVGKMTGLMRAQEEAPVTV